MYFQCWSRCCRQFHPIGSYLFVMSTRKFSFLTAISVRGYTAQFDQLLAVSELYQCNQTKMYDMSFLGSFFHEPIKYFNGDIRIQRWKYIHLISTNFISVSLHDVLFFVEFRYCTRLSRRWWWCIFDNRGLVLYQNFILNARYLKSSNDSILLSLACYLSFVFVLFLS